MSAIVNAGRALAAVLLLAAVTACGASTVADPARPLLADTPRVAAARDLRNTPVCRLLTPAQLEPLGLDPATARSIEHDGTEICRYDARDRRGGASVTSAYRWEVGGLDRLYRNREFIEVFRPGTLDGFPTLTTNAEEAEDCDLYVGVADDQLLAATANRFASSTGPPACSTARAIASAVLANLPPLR